MAGPQISGESFTEDMKADLDLDDDREGNSNPTGDNCVKVNEASVLQFHKEMNDKGQGDKQTEQPINAPAPDVKPEPTVNNCLYDLEDEINVLYELVPEVANHFTITSKIGEGAFSSVYLAKLRHYPEVNETFALKHILPTTHPSRIENELRCLLKIGAQDNVMGVKLCLRNRDNVVIVMPLLHHDKFQEYLNYMDVDEAREYMRNLLVALRRVHMFKVIHRDVKPSNFLYNRQLRQFALVDFGLASGAFLIDRDREKQGKAKTPTATTTTTTTTSTTSAAGKPDFRFPLSPSKKHATDRNAAATTDKLRRKSAGKEKSQMEAKPCSQQPKLPFPSLLSTSASGSLVHKSGLCHCLGKPKICSLCVARNNQMAPRAGTAGFRSPEVLLKSPMQDTAVDVWAAGVIFLSILSARYPFFRSQDDMGYLAQIISILGSSACVEAAATFGKVLTLSENVPPIDLKTACMRLRSTQMSFRLTTGSQNSKVIQSWSNIADEPFDLLSKMLDPNPKTRITAEEALNHAFFKTGDSDKL